MLYISTPRVNGLFISYKHTNIVDSMVNCLRKENLAAGFFLPLISLLLWTGCDGVTGVEGAIIDNPNNQHKLRNLLFVIRLVDQNDRSIVLNRLDSVVINVNSERWGVFTSDSLNTQGIISQVDGDFSVSDREVSYLVTAGYQLRADTFETAGAYSSYLNRRLRLEPGDYVAEIAELHFRNINGEHVMILPRIYQLFTIDEGAVNLYLGSFDIPIF